MRLPKNFLILTASSMTIVPEIVFFVFLFADVLFIQAEFMAFWEVCNLAHTRHTDNSYFRVPVFVSLAFERSHSKSITGLRVKLQYPRALFALVFLSFLCCVFFFSLNLAEVYISWTVLYKLHIHIHRFCANDMWKYHFKTPYSGLVIYRRAPTPVHYPYVEMLARDWSIGYFFTQHIASDLGLDCVLIFISLCYVLLLCPISNWHETFASDIEASSVVW